MKKPVDDDAIVVSDLTIAYPTHGISPTHDAIRGVSFRVERGEVLGLLGESGSGKSTLARVLAGQHLLTPSSGGGSKELRPQITGGDARIAGYALRGLPSRKIPRLTFDVGYLAQDAGAVLPADLTVADIIAQPLFARDKRYDRKDAAVRVATMLDSTHLPLLTLQKFPYELSSGQRQRVALARALVLGPKVLIADEPTAGIDVTVRDAVIDLIGSLRRERDFAALVVSHDSAVLQRAADRIAILHDGGLVGLGTPTEVFEDPIHPYVRSLADALAQNAREVELGLQGGVPTEAVGAHAAEPDDEELADAVRS